MRVCGEMLADVVKLSVSLQCLRVTAYAAFIAIFANESAAPSKVIIDLPHHRASRCLVVMQLSLLDTRDRKP